MKKYIEVVAVCPLLGGKPCIKDGWNHNIGIYQPCMFWDDYPCNEDDPEERCRVKRAINRILSDEVKHDSDSNVVNVPWDTGERSDNNGRTET